MAEYRRLPLHGKHGAGKFAKVDPDTYEWAAQHRWVMTGKAPYQYPVRYEKSRAILLHREVLGEPAAFVDHIDGDPLHALRANLRVCSHAENMRNRRPVHGTSRFKGVSWSRGRQRWKAEIKVDRRRHTIGRFENEVEAARAYDAAARRLHGPFARTNF